VERRFAASRIACDKLSLDSSQCFMFAQCWHYLTASPDRNRHVRL
jgi:hypothetical protein